MRTYLLIPAMLLLVGLLETPSDGAVVSVNFAGSDNSTLNPTDQAGNPNVPESFTSNWNNASGGAGTLPNLVNSKGETTGLNINYTAGLGAGSVGNTTGGSNAAGGANPQLMRGYLDAGNSSQATTVTLSGLRSYFTEYQLALFFDGSNGGQWRKAQFTITDTLTGAVLFQGDGEDSENVNFNSGSGNNANGHFQVPVPGSGANSSWPISPNNDEGNFLLSNFLTSDSITITAYGTGGALLRGPLNALQVIGQPVPEPSTLLLGGLGVLALVGYGLRRR